MKAEKAGKPSTEFERFDEAVKKIVRVPKKEIERRERERLAKKNGKRPNR